jgi:hypothetical protein
MHAALALQMQGRIDAQKAANSVAPLSPAQAEELARRLAALLHERAASRAEALAAARRRQRLVQHTVGRRGWITHCLGTHDLG